jgi:hypothetical protein
MLASYVANLGVSGASFESNVRLLALLHANAGNLVLAQGYAGLAGSLLFLLGNSVGALHTARALAGGLKGITQFENSDKMKAIQTASTTLLAAGGAALATNQWMTTVHDILNNGRVPADITSAVLAVLWTAFTTGLGESSYEGWRRFAHKPGPTPREIEERPILANGALVLAEVLQFASLFVPWMNPPSAVTGTAHNVPTHARRPTGPSGARTSSSNSPARPS